MEAFDELIADIVKDSCSDTAFIEVFPLCNVAAGLQSLFLARTFAALRHPFYPKTDVRIGMIGCGSIGALVLRTLLDFSGISAYRFFVSTRRPELLTEFQKEGVNVFFNNQKIIDSCDIIFVTALPH